jgi:hypothetical protein
MKPVTIVQIVLNCVLAFVPLVVLLHPSWFRNFASIVFVSPLFWVGSFILCYRSSGRNKRVLWLLLLAPIAWGPSLFELVLIIGLSHNGI